MRPKRSKVRRTKRGLPRCWRRHPKGGDVVYEADLRITPRSRLRAKLLVFPCPESIELFWWHALGRELSSKRRKHTVHGVVTGLRAEVITIAGQREVGRRIEVDPRYFCIIGLHAGDLTPATIAHESVHTALAYHARVQGRLDWPGATEMPEEAIAYPTGIITGQITDRLTAIRKSFAHWREQHAPTPKRGT